MMTKKGFLLLGLILGIFSHGFAQDPKNYDQITLTFVGDVMGHDTQIEAAYDAETDSYDYDFMFQKIRRLFLSDDFTIANLEVTLAGEPYRGYPQFGSPDELAIACKRNGIDAFVTSNNHSCDRRKLGVVRTIDVLDSLEMPHTGTFRNAEERPANNLMILEKNNIRVGILNYTYGTNGIPTPKPTVVNRLDTAIIAADLVEAQTRNLDKIIVFTHWGLEYKFHPNRRQINMANFLFNNGADIVIGSHPHVIQRSEYHPATAETKERFVAYSLGNFVSNMRSKGCDTGMVIQITLSKDGELTAISDAEYHLVWVHKPVVDGKRRFQAVPVTDAESNRFAGIDSHSKSIMDVAIKRSRDLLWEENMNVPEGRLYDMELISSLSTIAIPVQEFRPIIETPTFVYPTKKRKKNRNKR